MSTQAWNWELNCVCVYETYIQVHSVAWYGGTADGGKIFSKQLIEIFTKNLKNKFEGCILRNEFCVKNLVI